MSDKQFISNLSSTYADVRKLDVKKINLKGKNIEEQWGLNLPQDYPKFINRTQLFEDDNYVLYDDYGNLLFMNFSDKVVNGSKMFYEKNITTFNQDLPNLTNGSSMFYSCIALTSFTSDLSNLTNGDNMFSCCPKLTSFTSDLPSLTDGRSMFWGCPQLTSFSSDSSGSPVNLSSLTDGYYMFAECTNLTSFSSDLSSLTDGGSMFQGCNLDSASIENIFSSIPTYTSGTHTLDVEVQQSGANKIKEITGLTPSQTWQSTNYKGWKISFKIKS